MDITGVRASLPEMCSSGRAWQEDFDKLAVSGLASMYSSLIWSIILRATMDISALSAAHYRKGLNGPFGQKRVAAVAHAPGSRTSVSSHPLADLGG